MIFKKIEFEIFNFDSFVSIANKLTFCFRFSLLTNPDILRHLQSLQQQISAPTVALPPMLNSGMMVGQPPPPSSDNNGSVGDSKGGVPDALHHGMPPFGGVDFSQPPPGFTPMAMRLPHMSLGGPMGLHGMPPAVTGFPPSHVGSVAFPPVPPLPPQQQLPPDVDGRREDFYPPNNNNNNGDANDGEHNRINRCAIFRFCQFVGFVQLDPGT